MTLTLLLPGPSAPPPSGTATWVGPFTAASLLLEGVGLVRVNEGDSVIVTDDQAAALAASDPLWWVITE